MNLRFPLYAKILLWFFLNLVLLGLIFYGVFRAQFRLGLDSLIGGRAGERVQAMADVISAELNEQPREEWDAILKRFGSGYKVDLFIFRTDGGHMAGEKIKLPMEVLARFGERFGPMPPRFHPEEPQNRPPEFQSFRQQPGEPPRDQQPGQQREPRQEHFQQPPRQMQPMPGGPVGPPPRFVVRTSHPSYYWIGARMRLVDSELHAPRPAVLLARSDSLSGGGLFFDFTPWIFAGCAVVFISVLFWLPFARGITRSISQMTHATEEIAAGRFDARVDSKRKDELGQLGRAINQMASRLSGFVSGQKRFLGDTAHELCSPIARIQVALGILEQRADEKQKAYVEDVREEVQEMSSLVNELLSFSKASLEPAAIKLQPVEVRAIVEQAAKREADEGDNLKFDIETGIRVMADAELLQRSLANLIRNAVRYASHAGPITISAERETNSVMIKISDCGPGVPESALAQIFDPFFRPEPSRDRQSGGVGLGLSIVKTCIESCGGNVSCCNRKPSGFEVLIQLAAA